MNETVKEKMIDRIVSELPYTQNGKYDFRLLEVQGDEFVELQK